MIRSFKDKQTEAIFRGEFVKGMLKGDRKGQYSIRVNQQWRICFRWDSGDASDVELTDYH